MIVRELRGDENAANSTDQIMIRVDDADGVLEAARSRGAEAADASYDQPYGERQAGFVDPFGHRWVVTQTLVDVDPEEWGGKTVVARR